MSVEIWIKNRLEKLMNICYNLLETVVNRSLIMSKLVKKVYLPTGLLVSMYNLYGGTGKGNEVISLHDIQLLTACMEFYFNYTNPNEKKYIYRFYTLPHFYSGNRNEEVDVNVKKKDRILQKKYANKYTDDSVNSELFKIACKLREEKIKRVSYLQDRAPREIDLELDSISGAPKTPYECATILHSQDFRNRELYEKRRFDGRPLFTTNSQVDASTFFTLNGGLSRSVSSKDSFRESEKEMREYLSEFFDSDSYKLLSENKADSYAPNVDTFINCFEKAIQSYKKMNVQQLNQKYIDKIEESRANTVDIEIIGE